MREPKILPILQWPDDERLHQKSTDVTMFDQFLKDFSTDLLYTMRAANGVGLAAPQVGLLFNVIAIWVEEPRPLILINPVITKSSEDKFKFNEGCLSVPGYFENRERPNMIVVKYQDVEGNPHEVEFHSLYAFVVQHEIDHLNGKVFVDNASLLKKQRIKSKMKKVARNKYN